MAVTLRLVRSALAAMGLCWVVGACATLTATARAQPLSPALSPAGRGSQSATPTPTPTPTPTSISTPTPTSTSTPTSTPTPTSTAISTATSTATSAPRLTVDLPTAAATTGGMLLLSGASGLLQSKLTPATCRWCEPDRLDRWARGQLRWRSTKAAGTASDALQLGVPAATALALWLSGGQPLASRETAEDLVVVAEAAAVAQLLTQGAKYAAARRRPDAWAAGTQGSADAKHSFWSAHTSFTFSVAAAATQVARLRGRPGWRWLALASFAGAAATGWLRVAADRHWLTDVVSGAAVGTATGLGVPLLVLVPEGARATPVGLAMAPGGLALTF